ncbi:alpha/beta hydrolase superfamily protein [Cordyceps javanica]|uniref:Alpha/beta hydrolase superfamily protein n=1 Tax=Cordyceps javanica TaxID=43265 RepID=A0A545UNH8_9HYPO|nr:alpha/beta hydrolase superfamily protein [Cordyceps javanica]TQW02771.1 alpha/beta hydrolase superfamily protein [Cordyceps javanica]
MSLSTSITILLVHGAWHGPWCWKFQIPELQKAGYDVETAHLPSARGVAGKTQPDDVEAVRSVLDPLLEAGKRVVVLAHSYGGPIGSAAVLGRSERERAAKQLPGGVVGLVCLCAFILPGGMDQGAAIKAQGGLPGLAWDSPSDGLFVPKDPRGFLFSPDCAPDHIDWALPQLRPQSMAANMGIVPPQAWQEDAENYANRLGYIACTDDEAVPYADEMAMLNGAGGKEKWILRELQGSGHSPFLSRPQELATVIHEIVEQFQKATAS